MKPNTSSSLLDELVFIPARLALSSSPPKTDFSFAIGTFGTKRHLRIGTPWFARSLNPQEIGKRWPKLCGLLRAAGIPTFCSTSHLESVPAASVPIRLAKRHVNEPLRAAEVKTADALELDSRCAVSGKWAWPAEVGKQSNMARFVQAVRVAAGNSTPIGLSLPVGASHEDLNVCVEASIDFLTLIDERVHQPTDALVVEGLVSARRKFDAAGLQNLPILVTTSVRQVDDVAKLLALGASCVCIDSLLMQTLKPQQPADTLASGGMLTGMGATAMPKQDLSAVQKLLDELATSLLTCMQAVNVSYASDLNVEHLRSLSSRASTITRIPLLGQ